MDRDTRVVSRSPGALRWRLASLVAAAGATLTVALAGPIGCSSELSNGNPGGSASATGLAVTYSFEPVFETPPAGTPTGFVKEVTSEAFYDTRLSREAVVVHLVYYSRWDDPGTDANELDADRGDLLWGLYTGGAVRGYVETLIEGSIATPDELTQRGLDPAKVGAFIKASFLAALPTGPDAGDNYTVPGELEVGGVSGTVRAIYDLLHVGRVVLGADGEDTNLYVWKLWALEAFQADGAFTRAVHDLAYSDDPRAAVADVFAGSVAKTTLDFFASTGRIEPAIAMMWDFLAPALMQKVDALMQLGAGDASQARPLLAEIDQGRAAVGTAMAELLDIERGLAGPGPDVDTWVDFLVTTGLFAGALALPDIAAVAAVAGSRLLLLARAVSTGVWARGFTAVAGLVGRFASWIQGLLAALVGLVEQVAAIFTPEAAPNVRICQIGWEAILRVSGQLTTWFNRGPYWRFAGVSPRVIDATHAPDPNRIPVQFWKVLTFINERWKIALDLAVDQHDADGFHINVWVRGAGATDKVVTAAENLMKGFNQASEGVEEGHVQLTVTSEVQAAMDALTKVLKLFQSEPPAP